MLGTNGARSVELTRSKLRLGPHFHVYREDTEELSDIPDEWLPTSDIPAPKGMRIAAIDVIVRLKTL